MIVILLAINQIIVVVRHKGRDILYESKVLIVRIVKVVGPFVRKLRSLTWLLRFSPKGWDLCQYHMEHWMDL